MRDNRWGSGRQPVQLIGINAPFQPRLQFGREYDAEPEKRTSTFQQGYDISQTGSRNKPGHAIKQPAPEREQTILSHRLSPELQRQLSSGFSTPQNSGRLQGNHFPRIEHIKAATNSNFQRSDYHVTTVPTIEGRMGLRAVAGRF